MCCSPAAAPTPRAIKQTATGDAGGTPSATTSAADEPTSSATAADPSSEPSATATAEESEPAAPPKPVSVLGLAAERHSGDRLRLGAVRERTAALHVVRRHLPQPQHYPRRRGPEESYTISGVLNVPTGRGPFPAVVLAHGYIDPAYYVRGQGMTRERGYLAARGYVALHVDYRNHAESTDDPAYQRRMRLGYTADVINAVKALRSSGDVPVDDDRVALFGRSMGGGVILKALVAAPGLVQAAAPWASVSSLEADNFRQFMSEPGDTRGQEVVAAPRLARREPGLLARELLAPVLRPHHRAGAARARPLRRELPAAVGDRHPSRADRGRRRRPAAVVRRRPCLRAGLQRRHGPHRPVLRPQLR